jgi:mono/diheme cytochrome c family protein
VKISLACSQRLRHKSFLLLFFKKEESSFSEEKEAKRLLFPALCFLLGALIYQSQAVAYATPTGFSAASIAVGAALFARDCAVCHGAEGRGDGKLAKTLAVPPANLTAPHVLMHGDSQMFQWVSEGIKSPRGARAMPGFAGALTETQRWELIDYIRAHNLGDAAQRNGKWPKLVEAPALQARCGTRIMQLHDLRGHFVRLVIGSVPAAQPADSDVVTIATKASLAGVCVANSEDVGAAYGIVAGLKPESLPGSQFLIDEQGALSAFRQGGAAGWDDPKILAAQIKRLRMQFVPSPTSSHVEMKMPM